MTFIISVGVGTLNIPITETIRSLFGSMLGSELVGDNNYQNIIFQIRIPRVLMALIVGAGLSLCGVVMQAVVQNPLAEPFLLGISSGGYLGAVFYFMVGILIPSLVGGLGSIAFAFIGAVTAAFSVIFLSSFRSQMSTAKLVLSGMIINAAFQAIGNFLIAVTGSYESITEITFWTMGSLRGTKWENCLLPLMTLTLMIGYFQSQFRNLNLLLQGDETAITLGVNVRFYRKLYIGLISFLVAVLVSYSGIIGFVGLIIPHIARSMVGANHKRLIPISVMMGGIFLMISDCVSRSIIPNMELPIGVFTALIGAPFFAYMMIKRNYNFSK